MPINLVALTNEQIRILAILIHDTLDHECSDGSEDSEDGSEDSEDGSDEAVCAKLHPSDMENIHLREALYALESAERKVA
jgi:hypothetical protein